MKRFLSFILIFTFVFMIVGCNRQKEAKKDIFKLVEKNYDSILKACEEKDADALVAIEGITSVNIVDGYVIVYCKGAGIAPSSQEYGFYYSEENLPVGISYGEIICDSNEMAEYESGYRYLDDWFNEFYAEQIKGNIYFYSNAY